MALIDDVRRRYIEAYESCLQEELPFSWTISSPAAIDLELLTLQLVSLCEHKNIVFQERHFLKNLEDAGGYLTLASAPAVRLSILSFKRSLESALSATGVRLHANLDHWFTAVDLDEFRELLSEDELAGLFQMCNELEHSQDLMTYGGRLPITNSVSDEVISNAKGKGMLSGGHPVWTVVGAVTAPLGVFSLLREDCYLTAQKAARKMHENLESWRRNVVRQVVCQLEMETTGI